MKNDIRILIADDHPIFRRGLREVIERSPHLIVVAEAEDGITALERIRTFRPDIAILDIDMPQMDGFAVAGSVRDDQPPVEIIFLTMYKDEMHFNAALDQGVKGYLIKDNAAADVVTCINAVAAGQNYMSPVLSTYLVTRSKRASQFVPKEPGLHDLTPTEQRVLSLLAEYKTSKEIAAQLFISVRTVENHRANICTKLDLHGPHALVKFAIQHKSELP
jgi:DNA-binding NarL/FixJ family response regulator